MQKQVPGLQKDSSFSSSLHIKQITNKHLLISSQEKTEWREERGERGERSKLLARLQLGHFLHVDADALAVKQHKVDGLDGGRHGGHKVAGDSLQDELGRRLFRETIPDRREHKPLVTCGHTLERPVIFYLPVLQFGTSVFTTHFSKTLQITVKLFLKC